MSGRHTQRGMVLLAVLWAIALCAALAMATSTTFRSLAGIVRIDRERVQADGLLTAGLEAAAGIVAALRDAPPAERTTTLTFATGSVQLTISDEGGRIDIGKAPVEVLASLLRYVGAEDDDAGIVAQRIVALRDIAGQARPNDAQPRPGDAAKPSAPGTPDQPAAAPTPFTDIGQIADIPGMQAQWMAAMAPLITVFGSDGVNPLTAPVAVLRALPSFDAEHLDAFLDMRTSPFVDPERLSFLLGPAQKYLKVPQTHVVAVDLVAGTTGGYTAAARAFIVLLPDDKQPYRVLAWTPISRFARTGVVASLEAH
ncbi:general secretion pathway protein GspK [Bradyrhizobium erythrophlei]|uniref:Type II secretory pathway, component PulK n=1 Tax=Bradyrhizobium erythrophlei TaxID=1437360 RepID=A0A1H5HTM0_9BRAD|nr:type II secretion system protein GspK [Bradyrhizobium erythrophlei]SEE31312.1 Type II secretory pathway, component PulK [Bradyrhizobium erythrophlei]